MRTARWARMAFGSPVWRQGRNHNSVTPSDPTGTDEINACGRACDSRGASEARGERNFFQVGGSPGLRFDAHDENQIAALARTVPALLGYTKRRRPTTLSSAGDSFPTPPAVN